ncbi:MAG: S-methyl-5-thioribose-1-phosphate isomerase [Dehalococcoidia bacterium]|nr:S-methyl-5-thioribose-1-phosphate isomerase [Dehalococcoidia bacterium]
MPSTADISAPIRWLPGGRVRLIDQTLLPRREVHLETSDYRDLVRAIREMRVRGAPLIGITAAYALALAARQAAASGKDVPTALREAAAELRATRPTASNLAWALERMLRLAEEAGDTRNAVEALEAEAIRIHQEDIAACRRIGANGAALLPAGVSLLTHCNTGSLATGGYGTALGVVRAAWEQGKLEHVYITETRPLLQGARLTAWELQHDGIPFTLIVDGAAGQLLRRGLAAAVVVGADRIAANGDVANKVGTYALAALARESGVPFYVAAPASTIDLGTPDGDAIPIEERAPEEVTTLAGVTTAPEGTAAANPAFDITPAEYVTAIISENGVARPPYEQSLARLLREEAPSRG